MLAFERKARKQGFLKIAGVDEAGRGPLAGPVVAASCILPDKISIPYINDSKQLTHEMREKIFQSLLEHAEIKYGIGIIDHQEIDQINIFQATMKAMHQAIQLLDPKPDFLLIDGPHFHDIQIPCWKIVTGDSLSLSIAAASIIAKVTRDRIMNDYHEKYPEYDFNQNKGYGTEKHLKAIKKWGPCPIHRISFKPFKPIVLEEPEELQLEFALQT